MSFVDNDYHFKLEMPPLSLIKWKVKLIMGMIGRVVKTGKYIKTKIKLMHQILYIQQFYPIIGLHWLSLNKFEYTCIVVSRTDLAW